MAIHVYIYTCISGRTLIPTKLHLTINPEHGTPKTRQPRRTPDYKKKIGVMIAAHELNLIRVLLT